jgi:LruC domain-containing protein
MVGNDATSVLNITQQSDVYVTYVSSSAAFYNTIGYYTYNTASGPPTTAANITKVTYIFPNTRYTEAKYKGDTYKGILAGNKVKLGNFPAGTTIGFVLFQNAWDAVNRAVRTNSTKFYSNSALNPETNTAIRRHNVLLHDVSKDVYVMGFEDQLRSSTDNDFNDVVLYATATTKDAISSFQVANLPKADDTDGDGVLNIADKFPSDPNKAYISYFPSEVNWGTVAFEDNWPSKGDYDLNDLVVSYRYMYTSNANNQVVDITGDFAVSAAGASYKNGFGVQFPFSANIVSEVTGQKLTGSIITKAANGLEAGQLKAVIIPFDDHETLIKNNTGNLFINTENDKPKIAGDTAHVFIKLTTPQSTLTIGSAPFNPFLISNQRRGYEIHLPGMAPTDKADTKLFGTLSDRSILGNVSTYYKTDMNWPWAMSFTETFNFPVELQSIDKAYPHFLEWAGSTASPKPYLDWYSNTASGYRNSQYIYGK